MKPIHWIVGLVQAVLFPYIVVTAVQLALPHAGTGPALAAGVFGAGCGLAGGVLVYEYAVGR